MARASPTALIYSSHGVDAHPAFTERSTLEIMQRQWTLVWESTPAFELAERSTNPLFILIGGLLFTALLALLLIVIAVRRAEHIEQMVGERRFAVPMLVFLVIGAGSFALYSKLRSQELEFVLRQVQDEASKIGRCCVRRRTNGSPRWRAWRHAGNRRRHRIPAVAPRCRESRGADARPARDRVDRPDLPRALGRAARGQ